jgi:selenide, water dikinase
MAEGSGLSAVINFEYIPLITESIFEYIEQGSVPGGTNRNRDSYGHKIAKMSEEKWAVLADPQTSGGLLIAVSKDKVQEVINVLQNNGLEEFIMPIGYLKSVGEFVIEVV